MKLNNRIYTVLALIAIVIIMIYIIESITFEYTESEMAKIDQSTKLNNHSEIMIVDKVDDATDDFIDLKKESNLTTDIKPTVKPDKISELSEISGIIKCNDIALKRCLIYYRQLDSLAEYSKKYVTNDHGEYNGKLKKGDYVVDIVKKGDDTIKSIYLSDYANVSINRTIEVLDFNIITADISGNYTYPNNNNKIFIDVNENIKYKYYSGFKYPEIKLDTNNNKFTIYNLLEGRKYKLVGRLSNYKKEVIIFNIINGYSDKALSLNLCDEYNILLKIRSNTINDMRKLLVAISGNEYKEGIIDVQDEIEDEWLIVDAPKENTVEYKIYSSFRGNCEISINDQLSSKEIRKGYQMTNEITLYENKITIIDILLN